MRAKEFISEQVAPAPKRNPKDTRQLGQTQPAPEYHPKTFATGKFGVPSGVNPHDPHSQSQGNSEYGSLRGDIPVEAQAAMPGAFSITDLPSDFYGMYRTGLAIAAGDRNIAAPDNFGKHPFMMPFAPEEHQLVAKQVKRIGHKIEMRTTPQSLELSTNNTVSPVAKVKKNKYGI